MTLGTELWPNPLNLRCLTVFKRGGVAPHEIDPWLQGFLPSLLYFSAHFGAIFAIGIVIDKSLDQQRLKEIKIAARQVQLGVFGGDPA